MSRLWRVVPHAVFWLVFIGVILRSSGSMGMVASPCLGPQFSTANRSHVHLKIGMRSRLSHQIVSFIAGIVLDEMLGYSVEYTDIDGLHSRTSQSHWVAISTGLYDVDIEQWNVDPLGNLYSQYVLADDAQVVDVGLLGYPGRAGLYVFQQVLDTSRHADYFKFYKNATQAAVAGVRTFLDSSLRAYLTASSVTSTPQAELCNVQEYAWCGSEELEGFWATPECLTDPRGCVEIIKTSPSQDLGQIEQLVKNNFIQAVVGYYGSDVDALAEHLQSLQSDGQSVPLFYWWEPSALLLRVDAVRISFPDFRAGCDNEDTGSPDTGKMACDLPEASIHKLVSRRLREEAQEAYYFLSRLEFDREGIRRLLESTRAGGGHHETAANAACDYVRTSKQIESWAPKCLTHPGREHGGGIVEIFNVRSEECENKTIHPVLPPTQCFAEGMAPGKADHSDVTIRVVRRNWATHEISSTIAEAVLRDYLGYNVEVIFYAGDSSLEWGQEFSDGVYDFEAERWNLRWGSPLYKQYIDGGHVHMFGPLGFTGRSGLFVPTAALSKDPASDYYKFYRNASRAASLGWVTHGESILEEVLGDLHPQCSPSDWSWCDSSVPGYWVSPPCEGDPGRCIELLLVDPWWDQAYVEQLSRNNGLEVVISYAGFDIWTLVHRYQEAGRMVLFYWNYPDTAVYTINMTRVSFPDFTMGCDSQLEANSIDPTQGSVGCDFQEWMLAKIGNAWLSSYKDMNYAIRRMEIRQDDLDQLLPQHVGAGGAKSSAALACEFLHQNTGRLREWVPTCLTNPPAMGQASINDSIFMADEERCVELSCPLDEILVFQQLISSYECRPCGSPEEVPDATQRQCKHCAAGEEVNPNRTACRPCPAGSYALPRSGTCLPCPVGSFASLEGQSQCIACPTGTYQNLIGQHRCFDCPLGRSAPTESLEQCLPCVAGSIASERGLAACRLCESGTYQREQGGSSCNACNPGSYAPEAGSLFCLECLPGFFQPNSSSSQPCGRCPLGTFTETKGSIQCSPCALGTTSQIGADSRLLCQCPRNTFLLATASNGTTADQACRPCNEYMEPCFGSDSPALQKEGFFIRADGVDVYRCVSRSTCPGGVIGTCPRGSKGDGCADCDKGKFFWNGVRCEECQASDMLAVALFPIVGTTALFAIHFFGNDPIGHRFSATSEFLVVVGLGLNVILYLNSLSAFDVDWKSPVDELMKLQRSLTVEVLRLNFSCSASFGNVSNYMLASLIPLAIVCLATSLAVLRLVTPKKIFNTIATCVYGLYLPLLLHGLKPFRYVVHPGGGKSVFDMPSVAAGSDEHIGLIVVALGVMLAYCLPFALACVWASLRVARVRHSVARRWILGTFRFLFYKFRPQAYYWGVCILLRNIAFAVAPSIAPEVPKVGLWILALTSSAGAVSTAFIQPWRFMWMNVVDVSILCFVVMALCLAAGWLEENEDADEILATIMFFFAVIFGACAGALILWIGLQLMLVSKEQRQALRKEELRKTEMLEEKLLEMWDLSGDAPEDNVAGVLESLARAARPEPLQHAGGIPSIPAWHWVAQQEVDIKLLHAIAQSIRVRDYSLEDYYKDCMQVFPELQLYLGTDIADDLGIPRRQSGLSRMLRRSSHTSGFGAHPLKPSADSRKQRQALLAGGCTSAEEQKRTVGALFAVYCICRLDIDGKEIMAFGVDEACPQQVRRSPTDLTKDELKELPWGKMSPSERRAFFYWHFDWDLFKELFLKAGILMQDKEKGGFSVDAAPGGRLIAMLSLTAYHDIMKDRSLCPTVEGKAYGGVEVGQAIADHDLALAYVLDRHPETLPSFRVLTTEQRRVVRFTQSEMGFNAGWLVQAEGPPSAVLGKIKKAITQGTALASDVAFYFAHWVTDLAGAEPTPFSGSEKFAVKFPPPILQGLLSCFAVVETLADKSETQVYEAYIMERWMGNKQGLVDLQPGLERVAKWRLNCMAQQHARSMLEAFDKLPAEDRHILTHELASTGLIEQEFQDWTSGGCMAQVGTPFLLYYGPAWCQRTGGTHPVLCLRILADLFRLGRETFPESMEVDKDQKACIRSRSLEVGFLKTVNVEDLLMVYEELGRQCLSVKVSSRSEAIVEPTYFDV